MVEARADGVRGKGTWPELSLIVTPGSLAFGSDGGELHERAIPRYQTGDHAISIKGRGTRPRSNWAGEPDGTQSGLPRREMTVRRPTIVHRAGCGNPLYADRR